MPLFNIPQRADKTVDVALAKKANAKTKAVVTTSIVKGTSVLDKVNNIKAVLEQYLGKYKEEYLCIRDEETLKDYIKSAIQFGFVAIDTETDGLDPLINKIAGFSVYYPSGKAAYVPLGHISVITNQTVNEQVSLEAAKSALTELFNSCSRIIMFNADFDIRVLKNMLGVDNVRCDFDCLLAARLLNENEPSNALKRLHQKYVLDDAEDEFKYDELFKGLPFTVVPINPGYLYAAHDAKITYELYEYQCKYLYYDRACRLEDRNGLNGVSHVFYNIEMPCVSVVADMEDTGILIDTEYARELSIKYHNKLDESLDKLNKEISKFSDEIEEYRKLNPSTKLETPVNINSPTQLAILLYDVLGVQSVDKKYPRGTGEAILEKIAARTTTEELKNICNYILEYREIAKLLSTYIDKLPECVNPKDGRIHCRFNQYGAATGRFSSSDPNLQNIPSHNKDIRKMFIASDGYVLMSSDYSQQEPKCLAALCRKAGDSQMYDTFMNGKDLYSEIASKAFNVPYEKCREFNSDGSTNPAGKERRSQAKSILLGVLYGRGVPSIAEQLGTTTDKAQTIKDSVFKGFPAIRDFENSSLDMAEELGYVTTVCGRKRRLPDIQLDEFEFKWKDGVKPDDDLLDFDEAELSTEVDEDLVRKYLRKLRACKPWDKRKIFEEANKEGIWIVDNGVKIADAQRQCVNARIQGSAADLTKLAMIDLSSDKRLKQLGFRLLIPVHDEVIAECPIENAKECSKLLAEIMSKAAEKILEMPVKCDVTITKAWYGEEVSI